MWSPKPYKLQSVSILTSDIVVQSPFNQQIAGTKFAAVTRYHSFKEGHTEKKRK